jgi:phytoene synthase
VLYQLAAMVLNGGIEVETGDAAGHLGVAHALTGHLRAFGYNASTGRIFLPMSIFAANGVTEAEILAGKESEGLFAALGQVSDLAREHVVKARSAIAALPRPLRPAFAPIAVLTRQIDRIAVSRAPFAQAPDLQDWQRIAMMAWWAWRS